MLTAVSVQVELDKAAYCPGEAMLMSTLLLNEGPSSVRGVRAHICLVGDAVIV